MPPEIGGYRELDLRKGFEYYTGGNVARLNSARAGICHAAKCIGCRSVALPYYECESVRDLLEREGFRPKYYPIDRRFRPVFDDEPHGDTAVLVVNYFGLLPAGELEAMAGKYSRLIVDNAQGFFTGPIPGAYTVYSPRKFFGVPDGCYVVGENAARGMDYETDASGMDCAFLLRRIENGGNANHALSLENEGRISRSGVKRMSPLTRALLDNIDYEACRAKRNGNYRTAKELFAGINQLRLEELNPDDGGYAPMAYPLYIQREGLRRHFQQRRIYVGQWWKHLLREMPADCLEYQLSRYLIPIQIDQRYGEDDIRYQYRAVMEFLEAEQ